MHGTVVQEDIDALCPELAAVVDDAVGAGNEVTETWRGFGQAVRLKAPAPVLGHISDAVRSHLAYLAIDDSHYWLGEIHCRLHPEWFIALSFGRDRRDRSPAASLPDLEDSA